jgi:hypothetical protein
MRNAAERSFWTLRDHPPDLGEGICSAIASRIDRGKRARSRHALGDFRGFPAFPGCFLPFFAEFRRILAFSKPAKFMIWQDSWLPYYKNWGPTRHSPRKTGGQARAGGLRPVEGAC